MPEDKIVVSGDTSVAFAAEAQQVKESIEKISHSIVDHMFDLAELLSTVHEKQFYKVWGFNRFGDWVNVGSGLDMSERTAHYLVQIDKKAKALGITREELKSARVSKLKEIFSLSVDQHSAEIKQLIASAGETDLRSIQEKVHELKTGEAPTAFSYITLKVPTFVKEHYIDPAFDLVRLQYGTTEDPETGEIIGVSDSRIMEFICQAYISDPNNKPEPKQLPAPIEQE